MVRATTLTRQAMYAVMGIRWSTSEGKAPVHDEQVDLQVIPSL